MVIFHTKLRESYIEINLEKTDETTKSYNNEQYLDYLKQYLKETNQAGVVLDLKIEMPNSQAHYKLNEELQDVVMAEYLMKSNSTGKTLLYERDYTIKIEDKYFLNLELHVFTDDTEIHQEALKEFNEILQSFSREGALRVTNQSLLKRLQGRIVLKVESNGEAYYVHPSKERMYYLGRPNDAFDIMRSQGVGISNTNLKKIPIGLSNLSGSDTDRDGLSDIFEDAIGTDKTEIDTDGDSISDKDEIKNGQNPLGVGNITSDQNFSNSQKGKIFLQVEGKGEAWYIHPGDGKRYFLGRPSDAFELMRNLGMGVSDSNFDSLR